MAPSSRPSKSRPSREEEDFCDARGGDRKARKPLVEKKRRARINESLQELRLILADTEVGLRQGRGSGGAAPGAGGPWRGADRCPLSPRPGGQFQAKMENAEVLELTVKRVQGVLQSRSLESDKLHREASERFAAGYIQCMHEVHTFVSNCPGIDSTVAAELLNHLLESMPLNEGSFQDLIADVLSEPSISPWPGSEGLSQPTGVSPAALSLASPPSALLSPSSSEETCSDLEETEAEQSPASPAGLDSSRTHNMPSPSFSKSMWRPW
ncbi:transcription cofactor HES-6 isoform X1 [Chelonia mydas]|uniref:transcription cofactor HES-6 isoform X1 n=1 Tax=Chelonia mydas TaxID=8469 RepID=UPI0018A23B4A|nr:transcription cofactor HES-6 isoform X1 [Chelonia mydas]